MAALVIVFLSLLNRFRCAWLDPEFRVIALMTAALLAVGTTFYSNVEGWSVLDALYFSVITLATVGYGDLVPHTAAGKIFTMMYLMLGIGLIVAFADRLVRSSPRHRPTEQDASLRDATGERRT
jgi:hypothetical protein